MTAIASVTHASSAHQRRGAARIAMSMQATAVKAAECEHAHMQARAGRQDGRNCALLLPQISQRRPEREQRDTCSRELSPARVFGGSR